MSIYYQHIGAELFERDAPISLEHPRALRRFCLSKAIDDGDFMEENTGVQIWGLPTGAATVCRRMGENDYLMLLGSDSFLFIGRIVHRWHEFREDLSFKMWGEGRFSIIVALDGDFIKFPWLEFVNKFEFDRTYHMRGNTMSLAATRRVQAGFATDHELFEWIVSAYGDR